MKVLGKKGIVFVGLGIVLLGVIALVGGASALTEEELIEYSLNDIMFYKQCGTSGGSSNECGITVAGSTIEEKIWSGLTSFLTEEQAAGAMGSMVNESGFSPAKHEYGFPEKYPDFDLTGHDDVSYGLGLMQWSGERRVKLGNFLKEKALDLWTKYIDGGREEYRKLSGSEFLAKAGDADTNTLIALELCYMKQESEENPRYANFLKASSVGEASDYFVKDVESPRDIPGQQAARRPKAQAYYDQFHGKTISGSAESSSDGSGDPCNACAQGSKNINGTAVCLAWPLGTDKSVYKYAQSNGLTGESGYKNISKWTGGKATDAFNAAIDAVYPNRKWSQCPRIGASCDVGVGTTVRFSGVDPEFPRGLGEQIEYAQKHSDLWEVIEASGASPQAGDVVNDTRSGHHTYIIVQDEKGDFYRAESGLCSNFWRISRKFNGFESGARILRAKNAKNSTNGVDVENGVKTSSLTGTVSGGTNQGNGDINASAFALAWPEGTSASTSKAKAWDKFVEVFNSLPGHKNTGGQTWKDGKSCMVFVNTVLHYAGALTDKEDKLSSVTPYILKSDDWEEVGGEGSVGVKYKDLEPGDVLAYFRSGKPDDGETYYKGLGIGHEAIYGETASGEGRIIEAHFEAQWGNVREKKPNPNSEVAGGWAPIVRVFRWKKQKSGACDVCDDGDSGGQLKAGGFDTVEEATAFMQSYIDAASPGGKYYGKSGSILFGVKNGRINDGGCPYGVLNNCVAFSQWFINNYTTLGPNWNDVANGKYMVDKLEKAGLERGNEPRPYAVFSNEGVSEYGHTGVILGVNTETQKAIIGEAACQEGRAFYKPTAREVPFSQMKGWRYAYTDGKLSMGGPLRNA